MQTNQGTLTSSDGLGLFYQAWLPDDAPKAAIVAIHGAGDHGSRFAWLAERLAGSGYAIYAPDLRGHGRSQGQRGFIRRWSEYDSDLRATIDHVRDQDGQAPLFLMGHSLGGLLVLEYATRRADGLAGVAAISPGLRPQFPRWKVALARVLTKMMPRLRLDAGFDIDGLSRDLEVMREHHADTLRWSKGSIRLGTEVLDTVGWLFAHANELSVPVCLFHGTADRLVPPDGTRDFFARLGAADKQLREYEGGYHIPWLDTNREELLADLQGWLADHLPEGEPSSPRTN